MQKEDYSQLKKLYVGNFSTCVTVDDIHKLFGLRSTNYLCDNCRDVEMPMRNHDQFQGFDFTTVSQHVTKKLFQLNGVEFQENYIFVKEAKSRRKSNVLSSLHSRPHVANNSSENENIFPRNIVVPGDITHAGKSVKRSLTGNRQNLIVIFGDCITRKIRVGGFSRELGTGHAKIKTFLGANSKESPHYNTPTLEDDNFDEAILHFSVNDLLGDIH